MKVDISINDSSFGQGTFLSMAGPPGGLKIFVLENIFIIFINWALIEKQLVKSDDFSVFRGGYLGAPEA